jgi:hypothetical protein
MVKRGLQAWFGLVLVILLGVTIYASAQKSVWRAYVDLGTDRWGLATLFDAYFGFIAYFFWVAYKEASWPKRLGWFVLLMSMGNFAIAGYALWQLARWDPKTGAAGLLLRADAAPEAGSTRATKKKKR